MRGRDKRERCASHLSPVVSLFHKALAKGCTMCEKWAHIADRKEMDVSLCVDAHHGSVFAINSGQWWADLAPRPESSLSRVSNLMRRQVTIALVSWFQRSIIAAMNTLFPPAKRHQVLPPCFPKGFAGAGKQISRTRDLYKLFNLFSNSGAGEGIRTLDPNLGKVVLYP